MNYRQVFLTFITSKSLKLSFTLNCVLKSAYDFKIEFKLTRFASLRQTFKAWIPYDRPDRPDRPSRLKKKMFRRPGRSYGNATLTIANDPDD